MLIEPAQRLGEVFLEADTVARLDTGKVDAAMAHQVADHVAAQLVVGVQAITAVHRQQALIEPRVVLGKLLDALAVAIADLADRGYAETDQVTVGKGRVTLEVALQGAVGAGQGQLVIRQGEVVHADIHIAGGSQAADGQLQQLHLALGRRHVFTTDQALRTHQLRQVRVAVSGDAVRAQGDDLAQGHVEAGHGLQRQAVDQVDTHRLELGRTGGGDQGVDLLLALLAIDCGLHVRVEVLHAEAQAVETELAQVFDLFSADGARVDLDGELVLVAVIQIERLM